MYTYTYREQHLLKNFNIPFEDLQFKPFRNIQVHFAWAKLWFYQFAQWNKEKKTKMQKALV